MAAPGERKSHRSSPANLIEAETLYSDVGTQ